MSGPGGVRTSTSGKAKATPESFSGAFFLPLFSVVTEGGAEFFRRLVLFLLKVVSVVAGEEGRGAPTAAVTVLMRVVGGIFVLVTVTGGGFGFPLTFRTSVAAALANVFLFGCGSMTVLGVLGVNDQRP